MVTPGSLFRYIHCLGYVSTSYPLYERVPFGTRPRASPFWYSSLENRSGVPSRNLFDTDTLPVRLGLRPPCRISRPPSITASDTSPPLDRECTSKANAYNTRFVSSDCAPSAPITVDTRNYPATTTQVRATQHCLGPSQPLALVHPVSITRVHCVNYTQKNKIKVVTASDLSIKQVLKDACASQGDPSKSLEHLMFIPKCGKIYIYFVVIYGCRCICHNGA